MKADIPLVSDELCTQGLGILVKILVDSKTFIPVSGKYATFILINVNNMNSLPFIRFMI